MLEKKLFSYFDKLLFVEFFEIPDFSFAVDFFAVVWLNECARGRYLLEIMGGHVNAPRIFYFFLSLSLTFPFFSAILKVRRAPATSTNVSAAVRNLGRESPCIPCRRASVPDRGFFIFTIGA
ncbi:MAG: hypothetical protein Q4F40_04130 [Akkermansia sp.]|nr:hypothetical protein [Akkermansia sp.]